MKKLLGALMLFCWSSILLGQANPVTWSFSGSVANGEPVVTAEAQITEGWKVYALDIEAGGPVPTSIGFDSLSNASLAGDVVVSGEKTGPVFDKIFEMDLSWYKSTMSISQPLSIPDGSATVKGWVEFMCCNDRACLPPKTVEFDLTISTQ